jgi:hypothetical protein
VILNTCNALSPGIYLSNLVGTVIIASIFGDEMKAWHLTKYTYFCDISVKFATGDMCWHALVANRSDEDPDNCHSACEFHCRDESDCIPHSLVCDRDWDCFDGSDEFGCDYQLAHNDCHPEFEFQVRQLKADTFMTSFFSFCNPILCAVCTSTFGKLCKDLYKGMQSTVQ